MLNGGPNGFFSVGRGLRQGDPLCPILFVLMEDVLSRNISKLVTEGKISPIVIRNGIHPTHMFFADDVFIFCNGAKKNIMNLMKLLEEYQKISGQVINKSKSKLFVDGTTTASIMQIKEMVQIEVITLPDKYLGVILQSGGVKISTIWPMVEIIQKKLAVSKGKLLSFNDGLENIRWCIGDGQMISIWFDSWIGNSPLIEEVGYNAYVKANINMKVSDLITKGKWCIPEQMKQMISTYTLPEIGIGEDKIIWKREIKGNFTVPNSLDAVWSNAKGKSPFFRECWIIAACATLKDLWFQKNNMLFDQVKPNFQSFKSRIKKTVYERGFTIKNSMWNNDNDNQVILFFNLEIKFQCIKPCFWIPPNGGCVMFCCDGASIGNPGAAGFGVVVRDHLSQVIGVISGGIGIATNYIAEVYAFIDAVELVVEWKLRIIILNSDSKTVISEVAENKIPWFVRMRWLKEVSKIQSISFWHSLREFNFAADTAAKRGTKLAAGHKQILYGRPSFLARIELPNVEYCRFC
ncbi:uncharacterized protein LOC113290759 [Papaver somniferum]|uniref:uncharacterized protein LOC113290759 n=1 Tax=Papaver somniferum TaxID=3469 RepID=UPI000E704D48|nr:uncharacterized protein LOC113290759 [Papaver somniferum]